jgi:hypothetical protein
VSDRVKKVQISTGIYWKLSAAADRHCKTVDEYVEELLRQDMKGVNQNGRRKES